MRNLKDLRRFLRSGKRRRGGIFSINILLLKGEKILGCKIFVVEMPSGVGLG